MNRFTRALAGALAAVLAVGSLAACGEKKRKLPEKQVLDHVYKYETKTLATYDEVKWDEDAQKDFKGYTEVQDTVLSPAGYAYRTVTVDKDYNTTAQSVSFGRFDGSDPVTVDTGLPTGSGDAVYFSATAVVPQGLAAVMDENRVIGHCGQRLFHPGSVLTAPYIRKYSFKKLRTRTCSQLFFRDKCFRGR